VHGQFYAVQARCSHAAQSLAQGAVRGTEVTCPRHGARFDIRTGECLAAPAQTPLSRFPVFIDGGKVCLDI